MGNKYRHKKTNLEVTWGPGSQRYFAVSNTNSYYIPKEVVEDSAEWEEIKPLTDFYGVAIPEGHLAYHVTADKAELTSVCNSRNFINKDIRILATFREYEQACQFQRIFVFLNKSKDLLITPGSNPSTYLKNVIKTIS